MKNSESKNAFSKRLQEAMRDAGKVIRRGTMEGIDGAALRETCGVTREMARRYLSGLAIPDPDKLIVIARWLDVNVTWLRDGVAPKRGVPAETLLSDEAQLLADYNKLSPAGKKWLLNAAKAATVTMATPARPALRNIKK